MARRKKSSEKPEAEASSLDMRELEDIVERAQSGALSDEDCQKLRDTIGTLAWLQQELANKNVSLARLRSLFGLKTSEKTKDVLGEDGRGTEPNRSRKPKQRKRKGHGRNGAEDYEGAERIGVEHGTLAAGDRCPVCAPSKRGKLSRQKPRTLVRVTGQAPLVATVWELQALRCNLCGKVFVAEAPADVGEKKYDARAASMIGLLKYGSGLPFNRLARLEGNLGIPLPAATQWEIVSEAAAELVPVHEELIRQAAQGRLLHNDDTSMEILDLRKQIDELERSGETDRTGIFSTGIVSELADGQRIALFFTGRRHAGENLSDVLARRAAGLEKPILMCDGLDRNLPKDFEMVVGNCLTHARRKYVEVITSFPLECRHVIETLRDVYKNDATARKRGMSDGERLAYHQEHSAALMDGLEKWMREQFEQKLVEPNSSLGKAIAYMQKRWEHLTLFLREPGAPLDNNLCERALKKAILHRKNSLFYKTENGARVGDLFMSVIHTAELAGVNAFDYLTKLLEHADELPSHPEKWLPWNHAAVVEQAVPSGLTE